MRNTLLALIALLLLGAGGAGAYYYFSGGKAVASVGETEEHVKADDSKNAKDALNHEFVELNPLILPIVNENGVSQVLSLVIVIEVSDSKKAEKVQTLQPRLKDAYIQELYGYLNYKAAIKGGVVQVDMLKKRLRKISDSVLGEGQVEDVLLQVVQQRAM